ncbi:hypothetical protein BJ322DRAFT_1011739, partial [Thelephora terrestris]
MIESWNPLTQEWKPKRRSEHIPERVQTAIRLAGKHKIELEALEPTEETKREMPVWLHRKANKEAARIYATDGAKCLKKNHRTHYMKQLIEMVEDVSQEHRKTNFCTCNTCKLASSTGCTHPQKCLDTATKLVETLALRWRPEKRQPFASEAATNPVTANRNRGKGEAGTIVNTVREPTDLKHSIRIFTEKENLVNATALLTTNNETQATTELTVYTDGSCIGNGTAEARAGSGVWYAPQDPRNASIRVPGKAQSNQVGELLAILHA